MNVLATARNVRTRGARSALGLALLAWLGFLVQPCAVAAPFIGTGNAGNGVGVSVITQHRSGVAAEQRVHCVDARSTGHPVTRGCEDTAAAGNATATKPLDTGEDGGNPALPAEISPGIQRIVSRPIGTYRPERLPRPVPITVAYCVYLE